MIIKEYQFNETMITLLKQQVGKQFIKCKHDPFDFINSVYQVVGIYTDQNIIQIKNEIHPINYYGAVEDICFLEICSANDNDIKSALEDVEQLSIPIDGIIKEIHVVNERHKLFENNVPTYDTTITRGLIFILEDDREISFEMQDPFSEMITICRGVDLINKFSSTDSVTNSWDDNCKMNVSRYTLILK